MSESKKIRQLSKDLSTEIASGVNKGADRIVQDVQQHVQIDTGNLARSYRVTQRATTQNFNAVVGTNVPYSIFHYPEVVREYKTVPTRWKQPPPALFKDRSRTADEVIQVEIEKAIEGIN